MKLTEVVFLKFLRWMMSIKRLLLHLRHLLKESFKKNIDTNTESKNLSDEFKQETQILKSKPDKNKLGDVKPLFEIGKQKIKTEFEIKETLTVEILETKQKMIEKKGLRRQKNQSKSIELIPESFDKIKNVRSDYQNEFNIEVTHPATGKISGSHFPSMPPLNDEENADELDYRANGSLKTPQRSLNTSKFVFKKESKSKSNISNTSRGLNSKPNTNQTFSGVRNLLQGSWKSMQKNTHVPGKSFEENQTLRTVSFSGVNEIKGTFNHQFGSFKKPVKDVSFSKNAKNLVLGTSYQYLNQDDV